MQVIQACTGEQSWWSTSSVVYVDWVDLATNIGSVMFVHCPRDANKVAHELAKDSFMNRNSCRWVSEAPDFIVSNLINDVIVLDG